MYLHTYIILYNYIYYLCVCLYLHMYDSYYDAISMSPLQAEFSQRSFASALGEWAPTGDRERDRDPVRLAASLQKCPPKPISNTNETMVKTSKNHGKN